MIIKGKSRSNPSGLAAHLGNEETNERVEILETRGTVAQDLRGAFAEMDAWALGTRCSLPLYHANLDPQPPHRLTSEQRNEAIDALEEKLGLSGHARIVVLHEKEGREHFHVVWSRIDIDGMRSVSDSHNYRKHEEVARELERRFGHERVQGAHHERDGVERPDRTPSRAELRQEERTGIKGKDVREEVSALFRSSDTPDAFRAALEDHGYLLAKGDRRDFVIVDCAGGIHSLARRIDGMKAAELRDFMQPLAGKIELSATEAKELQIDRAQGRGNARDDMQWEDKLPESVFESEKKVRDEQRDNKQALQWEDRLIASAEVKAMFEDVAEREKNKKLREGREEARDDAIIGMNYGKGEDYVSQSSAALKDHKRRQEDVDQPRPLRPDEREEELLRRQAEEATKRQQAAAEVLGPKTDTSKTDGIEMTDAKQERLSRDEKETETKRGRVFDDDDPDRQRETPGGGRTRSR